MLVRGSAEIGISDRSGKLVGGVIMFSDPAGFSSFSIAAPLLPTAANLSNFLLSSASSRRRLTSRPEPELEVDPAGDLGLSGDPGQLLFLLAAPEIGSARRHFIRSNGLSSI